MTKNTSSSRFKTGLRAENIACWWLRLKGYKILQRRFRSPAGEIDIIAKKGKCLIAVEVKARRSQEEALHAISPRQWQRIQKSLLIYHQQKHFAANYQLRLDAIFLVSGQFFPLHLKNAWQPDEN